MNCGLCKRPILGNEQYVTDHYKCSAELTQSLIAERDEAVRELKSLRALIRDLGVQDADDSWNDAVDRADAVLVKAEGY